MTDKGFVLRAKQIEPLAVGYGSCFATDMITVAGRKVGYKYRDNPGLSDSGEVNFRGQWYAG